VKKNINMSHIEALMKRRQLKLQGNEWTSQEEAKLKEKTESTISRIQQQIE
jgi:hypothetical protein